MNNDNKECHQNMSECCLNSKAWTCLLEDNHCQTNNRKWACIHELKCLYVFKQIEDKKGELNDLCEDLAEDKVFSVIGKTEKDIKKSCISSIKQKIYNIHFLSDKKIKDLPIRSNRSEATKLIYKEFKNKSLEQIKNRLRNTNLIVITAENKI